MRKRIFALVVALSALISSTCVFSATQSKVITVREGASIQAAVKLANPGDTIEVYPGLYKETVYIDKNDITIRGVVVAGEWPVMDGEDTLNDGILVAGHGVTVDRFFIRRFKGNGIMTQGANNYKIINNIVEGDSVYGIFPQFSNNGLVADNVIWNVHDAAIYLGMCENADVVRNDTFGSVMGIEIENSKNILVENNTAHDNSSGIQVTLLQGLPVKTASNTIVRRNFISNNNVPNFAPRGSAAAGTPAGTGIVIFAADDTVVEGNIITGNDSAAIVMVDHDSSPNVRDPEMDPTPDNAKIYDNVYWNNGTKPLGAAKDVLEQAGLKEGFEVMLVTKSKGSCIANPSSVRVFGADQFTACPDGATSAGITTMQLSEPIAENLEQTEYNGRFAYKAICAGCHIYEGRMVGPPMRVIQALYMDRPEAMAQWIANPTHKRDDYPEMPPQNYLSEEDRLAIANYILNDLGKSRQLRQSRE
ncbi:MAG: cytochrome-c peroxidase [Halieaceae bacterium]|jgi:parallel beta-helix repeat protein|nr:cytochrome-c peroxidase [Halieaceae bacterium]